jgi:exodeoxyribonuclease VII small subunit
MVTSKKKTTSAGPSAPEAATEEAPNFEDALERLETIVEELEGGSLTLEESIARYEEGVRLSRRLTQTLDEAEKRIERLVDADDPATPPTTVPMDLDPKHSGSSGDDELPF